MINYLVKLIITYNLKVKFDFMKKILLLIVLIASLSACKKNKCYIISDCVGNDLQNMCGSEDDVRSFCANNSPAGCTWTYRAQ